MSSLRILCRNSPQRAIALATSEYALVFQHGSVEQVTGPRSGGNDAPRCLVEFSAFSTLDPDDFRLLGYGYGTLGLITLDGEVFLCVVTGYSQAATVRPGETISRIDNVDFFCLSHPGYDNGLEYGNEAQLLADDLSRPLGLESRDLAAEYPFLALKKLLGDGSFYYSLDFNLTERLQNRFDKPSVFDIGSLDESMLWNSYMIRPLLRFRSNLPHAERLNLDSSQILTCVIRGFSSTMKLPGFVPAPPQGLTDTTSLLTIISRLSSRRAGTRFNSRGIDDNGNVANFVETEIVLWTPSGLTFSYVQVRGSLPIFWEQAPGLLPGQQKIEVTRSAGAAQPAFNKHFDLLGLEYGPVHVVNLLSEDKPGEAELSMNFRNHIAKSPLKHQEASEKESAPSRLQLTEYDFHVESRSPQGYAASTQLKRTLSRSIQGFAYFLGDVGGENILEREDAPDGSTTAILQQRGVFRTNCLDCLDRTNLVQTVISSAVLESFLLQQGVTLSSQIDIRHSSLWADNGDALSKIYAGTGAIKSSFTRHGKMSLAGALADARKSATRLYINNFSDKLRQNTIDLLLGRLAEQAPVHLYDPVNDSVSEELTQRASEYTSSKTIRIWTGTFNVNGRNQTLDVDLTPWLFPPLTQQSEDPTIFAVAFQEIVPLNPQQIMSTDHTTRKAWENMINNCLHNHSRSKGTKRYVLLRTTQLVGAALMVYVREDALREIRNVEGSTKKTGLQGISGNKGGCAIRFEYSNTRLCFVSGHFAAGAMNFPERNRDYETIYHELEFQRNRSIKDHDTILWLGDFNYRISLDNEYVRELAGQGKYQELFAMDQLNHQMSAGLAFPSHLEGPVTFPPTYKYDVGTDDYDTSEKARTPAWCDRVLWKGQNLHQTHYNTADLRLSDHRPVWATFDCIISVIDESRKDKLMRRLYSEGQQRVRGIPTKQLGYETTGDLLAPDLPPPSSDYRKWWLDNGASERSAMRSPADGLFPNPHRKSNPFLLDAEVDWTPGPAPAATQRDTNSEGAMKRSPPVPPGRVNLVSSRHQATTERHDLGTLKQDTSVDAVNDSPSRIGHNAETHAPPIPPKPVTLRPVEDTKTTSPAPAGRVNADSIQIPKGSLGGQPSFVQDGRANRPPQRSGFQSSGAQQSNGNRPAGHGKRENNTADLLGGKAGEEVSWKPLLR